MRKVPETATLPASRNEQRFVLMTPDELDERIEAAVARALAKAEPAPEMLDVKGAKALGVGRRTFYRLVHDGMVAGHRVGRSLVVKRSELAQWVAAQPAALQREPREADPVQEALASGRLRVVGGKR
jgi:excisionase family DNA binding protein